MKFAQIVNGKVHGVFEYDALPDFAPNIEMVSLDGVSPEPKAGWLYDGSSFIEPSPEPAPDYGTRITRLAMRNRFTFQEKVAIETAAESSPSVRVWLKDLEVSTFIDLARPDTQAGVQQLETDGLIGSGRATEILNSPVQAEEVPQE